MRSRRGLDETSMKLNSRGRRKAKRATQRRIQKGFIQLHRRPVSEWAADDFRNRITEYIQRRSAFWANVLAQLEASEPRTEWEIQEGIRRRPVFTFATRDCHPTRNRRLAFQLNCFFNLTPRITAAQFSTVNPPECNRPTGLDWLDLFERFPDLSRQLPALFLPYS